MNVIGKFGLLSAVCGLVACKAESQLDLTSFNLNRDNHPGAVTGYVITEQSNLMSIPDDFVDIHELSEQLHSRHWLQHPDFLGKLTKLKSLFRSTQLPEAAIFIDALEATKQRYLSNINNVNSVARAMQREIDNDLDCYNSSIGNLSEKMQLLNTSEDVYISKIQLLNNEIEHQSRQYRQLSLAFHQSLQQVIAKHNPDIKLIDDLKFDYDNRPHSICRQYKGMSELLTAHTTDCVYINRNQLLSPFPSYLKEEASGIIDNYAPEIWRSLTRLSGYFDTTDNKQYFPDNAKSQLAQARKALREKRFLGEQESAMQLESYQQQLAEFQQKRDDKINEGLLNQQFRIDTSSTAFIARFTDATSPIQPFSDLYHSSEIKKRFTKAYARKVLNEYPPELYFQVSPEGVFSIPKQNEANRLIIDFANNNQFISYDLNKRSELPHVISTDSHHMTLITHSLMSELELRLRQHWAV